MSEMGDDFKALREHNRALKDEQVTVHVAEVETLVEFGYDVVQLTPYHYRINKALDVYPVNRRYHVLPSGERGGYRHLRELAQRVVKR
jgi:hypothetical protein